MDQVGRIDRSVAEAQMRNGNAAGFLRVIGKVGLRIERGFVADNFNELNNYLNNLNLVAKNVAAVIFEHFGGKDSIKIPGINISKKVLKTGLVNTSVLNVRSGASATYSVVRQIKLTSNANCYRVKNRPTPQLSNHHAVKFSLNPYWQP